MTLFIRFAMVAVPTSLLLAACGGAATNSSAESLLGQWEIEQIADDSGDLAPPVDGTSPHMAFMERLADETTVAGTTGCNSFSGPVEIDDDGGFSSGMFVMTLIGCPDNRATQEGLIIGHMTTADSWAVEGQTASLSLEGAEALLLRRIDTSLEGSAWLITGINNQKGGVQSVVIDTEPILWFQPDGSLSGTAGCNDLTGSYTVNGPTVEIGPVASTRMFCQAPEGVMDQEQNMVAALANASTYQINGFSLTLRDAEGHTMLSAQRIPEPTP